jgi:ubiquitin-conjugating enzyme E2 J1
MERKRTPEAASVGQFGKVTKVPNDWLRFALNETNVTTWYVELSGFSGDDGEYQGGVYLARMELPPDFPFKPPTFYILTPNGLYIPDKIVCVSIGQYHADAYRATLGVPGFCNQLVSGLVGWKEMGGGINLIKTTLAEKKKLAAESVAYNRKYHSDIMKMIDDSYAAYSSRWIKPEAIVPAINVVVPTDAAAGAAAAAQPEQNRPKVLRPVRTIGGPKK